MNDQTSPHENLKIDKNDPSLLFLNLNPDEEIKYILRRHWAGFVGTVLMFFGMSLVAIILFLGINILNLEFDQYKIYLAMILSGYFLFILTFLFASWINFYFDIVIVTNERMINISQEGLLSRKVSELRLRQIQNVTSQQSGILQTFLNFGLLVVETAGEGTSDNPNKSGLQGYFTIQDMPDSNRIARSILELARLQHVVKKEDMP